MECAGAPGGTEVEAGGELAGEGAGVLQGEDAAGHGVGHALLPALREGLVDGGAVAVGAAEGCDTGRVVISPVRICSRRMEWVPVSWSWVCRLLEASSLFLAGG